MSAALNAYPRTQDTSQNLSMSTEKNRSRGFFEIIELIKGLKNVHTDIAVSQILSITPASLRERKRHDSIPYEEIISFCRNEGISVEWMLFGEGEKKNSLRIAETGYGRRAKTKEEAEAEYVMVPLHSAFVGAGGGAEITSEQIVDWLAFRLDWVVQSRLNPGRLALVTCVGESMIPSFADGDLLLVDTSQTDLVDGRVYVIQVDNQLLAKRIQRRIDGGVAVISDNPIYPPQILAPDALESLRIIGRVVWSGRKI